MSIKKLCAATLMSVGLLVATPSSAVVIGGIDFGALGNVAHIETATLAETFVNGPGQVLSGYGVVTTVNGAGNYCAGGGNNCALYYSFTGYTVTTFTPTDVRFTGGTVNVYYDANPAINLLGQSSPANVAFIQSLTLWASMTGHTFFDPLQGTTQTLLGTGSLTGAFLSATGTGQLDVVGGVGVAGVADYLNGNSIPDLLGGFADMIVTTSASNAVLNPFDVAGGFATGCQTGTAAPGAWCQQGTLNVRGATNLVAEPSSLALLGLGLLGFAWFSRKSRA